MLVQTANTDTPHKQAANSTAVLYGSIWDQVIVISISMNFSFATIVINTKEKYSKKRACIFGASSLLNVDQGQGYITSL